MVITEQSGERLVIAHGSGWLLGVFAVSGVLLGAGVLFSISRLGLFTELSVYGLLAFAATLYGLAVTRLTTFTFDVPAGRVSWRHIGLIPGSGSLPFDRVDKALLDVRRDRRGAGFYRVLLATGRDQAVPLTPGRTRDLFLCLDVADAISAALGQETAAALVASGDEGKALRLLENRYGVERKQAEAYLARRHAPPGPDGPACELPS